MAFCIFYTKNFWRTFLTPRKEGGACQRVAAITQCAPCSAFDAGVSWSGALAVWTCARRVGRRVGGGGQRIWVPWSDAEVGALTKEAAPSISACVWHRLYTSRLQAAGGGRRGGGEQAFARGRRHPFEATAPPAKPARE